MNETLINEIINNAWKIITDKRYYYSQDRSKPFAMDCSLLVITAVKNAGVNVSASYTGDMVEGFRKSGRFDILAFSPDRMRKGDILLKHISGNNGHTVLYIGDNVILEACNTKYGLRKTNYYPNSYQYIIRLKDQNVISDLPILRNGSECLLVGLLQMFLNKYEGCRLKTDCEYGPKTTEAIKNFQLHHANDDNNPTTEIDGITGQQTWKKIYSILLQN